MKIWPKDVGRGEAVRSAPGPVRAEHEAKVGVPPFLTCRAVGPEVAHEDVDVGRMKPILRTLPARWKPPHPACAPRAAPSIK